MRLVSLKECTIYLLEQAGDKDTNLEYFIKKLMNKCEKSTRKKATECVKSFENISEKNNESFERIFE